MRLYLANLSTMSGARELCSRVIYALESFFYWQDWEADYLRVWKGFLLDSGAFTYLMKGELGSGFTNYVARYIDFINANKIASYFEMDVDNILGYSKVRSIRRDIENRTGRQSIPVWHISRGIEDLKATCRDYPYISIGQNVNAKGVWVNVDKTLTQRVIDIAHENGAKIHGLGRTSKADMRAGFDSVDSTSWLSSCKWGQLSVFANGHIRHVGITGRRLTLSREEKYKINLGAWVKMQKYAEAYL